MTDNSQIRSLFMDAMTGKINRREIFKRGAAIGVGATALASLATLATNGAALASKEGIGPGFAPERYYRRRKRALSTDKY